MTQRSRSSANRRGRILAGLGVMALVFALLLLSAPAAVVRAGDPTVDSALWILAQKTASAGQTRDARDAEIANQRLTTTALENQQRALSIQQTQTAVAQTATAFSQNATATAEVRAMQTAQAQATATAQAQQTAAMRAEQTTTAQQQAIATAHAAAAITVEAQKTEVVRVLQVQQTATRVAEIAVTDTRNAQLVSTGAVVGALIALLTLAVVALRAAWQIKRPVFIVEESQPATVAQPAAPMPGDGDAEAQGAPVRIASDDPQLVSALDRLFKNGTEEEDVATEQ